MSKKHVIGLSTTGIFFDCLFMRKAGDSRKDAIIKEEILF